MNEIRDWLWIGKYRETTNRRLLEAQGIEAMLLLAELVEHPTIRSVYLPVEDGEPLPVHYLEEGVAFLRETAVSRKKTLVACGAGISRSATFCVAALKEIEGLDLLSAYRVVKQAHPATLPHFKLWQSLCDYYQEDVPWRQTLSS